MILGESSHQVIIVHYQRKEKSTAADLVAGVKLSVTHFMIKTGIDIPELHRWISGARQWASQP